MLTSMIDVPGGDIRLAVALGAGVWLSRDADGEPVPRVTGRAGSEAAIGIDSPHALIRPVDELRKLHVTDVRRDRFEALDENLRTVARVARIILGSLG